MRLSFSEKMDRVGAYRWLEVYPDREVAGTSWKGSKVAVVRFEEPFPADTVVVVELLPGMQDNHRVPQHRGRTFVFATGDSIYDGAITGLLVLENEPLRKGVVEIVADGPDTVRLAERPVLRRATTDSVGAWTLPWLPASGDGWLLRAYADENNDRRQGDNEAARLWPDTLRLTLEEPRLDTGLRVLFRPDTPGRLNGELDDLPDSSGAIFAFLMTIAESDTGYVPAPQPPAAVSQAVADTGAFVLGDAGPGWVRAVFFVDVDGDSLFSAVGQPADTLWALEPWALVDSLEVEPGLPTAMPAPVWPDTLTPWAAPARLARPALADSLTLAYIDSLGAVLADSLGVAESDSLRQAIAAGLGVALPDTLAVVPPDTLLPGAGRKEEGSP